ncbi:MAG: molybdate ABC transporter permease subunit [Gammaproteobacteria bacterium]|nr:molybdate ABC transporter permease subunit [Gammaproteobacteria bacterium]
MDVLSSESIQVIKTTLVLALYTTFFLQILALPLAWWLAQKTSVLRLFIQTLVTLPLVLPPTVLGFYILVFLGPSGPLSSLIGQFGLTTLAFSFTGILIGSIVYSLPFAILPILTAFQALGKAPFEVAATMGASPWYAFRTIALPLARNGILTSMILTFAHTLGEFGIVLMIGGNIPGKTQVVSTQLFNLVELLDYRQANILAGGMLIASFFILFGLAVLQKNARERVY